MNNKMYLLYLRAYTVISCCLFTAGVRTSIYSQPYYELYLFVHSSQGVPLGFTQSDIPCVNRDNQILS